MGQLFKPAANSIATASLVVGALLPFVVLVGGSQLTRSPANTKVGMPLDQPVPFSHKHHVKELGIDCRYCHTTVETQANASVPATEVCMSCHSQIWTNSPYLEPVRQSWETDTPIKWRKVNAVPDFVYFDHSIHIDRGISCNTCHGAVQEMHITWKGQPLHMAWCLDCHKNPEKYMFLDGEEEHHDEDGHEGEHAPADLLTPRQKVFNLYKKIAGGEKLSEQEQKLAEGLPQQMPTDKTHAPYQAKIMEEAKINVSQLADCYICHH